MSSFLADQAKQRRGKWTPEEELYAASLMEAFKDGSILEDVEEGMSLRGYLAMKLRTGVKRISKKYEGTNYEGKRIYLHKPEADLRANISAAEIEAREAAKAKLKELERKFEESVKMLEDAIAAKPSSKLISSSVTRQTMCTGPSKTTPTTRKQISSLNDHRDTCSTAAGATARAGLWTPAAKAKTRAGSFILPSSNTGTIPSSYVSSKVIQDNMRILALQAQAQAQAHKQAHPATVASDRMAAVFGQPSFRKSTSADLLLATLRHNQQQQQLQQEHNKATLYLAALASTSSNSLTSAAEQPVISRASSAEFMAAAAGNLWNSRPAKRTSVSSVLFAPTGSVRPTPLDAPLPPNKRARFF
ncbi:expressed unknown protein [Seminavis robusta]|uniref:Uncharacterized protein n=1 Tax=Seminavis robusta TaxID=568900 RepID=A0A9N8HZ66_9STRA|nr:expressed unknown protein [Seminavis robusta]|eukprot:Sro3267_g346040.1 n/a (360) ;mRNA; r:4684-5763